jgi:hypothetical protein
VKIRTQTKKEEDDPMKEMGKVFSKTSNRRSFLKNGTVAAGAATLGAGLLGKPGSAFAEESSGRLTQGDAAILRFLAAAEILETDLWQQYNELGGVAAVGGPSQLYITGLIQLDADMPQYIADNTDDELTHEQFINAYLASKGADTVDLSRFANLTPSKVDGVLQTGRLTNLMHLNVDTSWWTRYRSSAKNPDFGDTFRQAVNITNRTAIPRTNDDLVADATKPSGVSDRTQAISNVAGFHFGTIEQGGSSLYPSLAQRVTNVEVLRIVLSIGGTEITHFQTWHDKAGNAPPLTDIDPVTGSKVVFHDLNNDPGFGGEDFQTNLIMPEPTIFLSKKFSACSIIRPTETRGAAMGALKGLTADGLFVGQSKAFFDFLRDLAEDADEARREL